MLRVECLMNQVVSGAVSYPVYVGFLSAVDIARVAEAPSFLRTTAHQQVRDEHRQPAGQRLARPMIRPSG